MSLSVMGANHRLKERESLLGLPDIAIVLYVEG